MFLPANGGPKALTNNDQACIAGKEAMCGAGTRAYLFYDRIFWK
jgi:hypothetical protein